jgi:NDP-sugar pyrophosphorylase family protein
MNILHDLGRPLCFVGDTYYNNTLYDYFQKNNRVCIQMRVEDIENLPQDWFDQYQFMCAVSTIEFKYFVSTRLAHRTVDYFSVVGDYNVFCGDITIGKNTFINSFNFFQPNVVIGDHCTIATHAAISHHAVVNSFSHVSAYTMINHAVLEQGCCVGLRSSILGKPKQLTVVPAYTNLMAGSIINKSLPVTGTYYNKRKMSDLTSLTYELL